MGEVFKQAEDKEVFRRPRPIKKWLPKINQNRYRRFYRITGHHIDDCRELKEQIKSLIRRGQLTNFISKPEETTHPIPILHNDLPFVPIRSAKQKSPGMGRD